MASYHLHSKHFSRAKGSKVTRAAAYRAGERIVDQRSGEVYNHTHRRDIPYKEVLLPEDLASRPEMSWARQREVLWNAVEKAGKRKNAALARELLVTVPPELTAGQRVALVRRFGSELADRYRTVVDVCLHLPRPESHENNHHAHLLMSTREVGPRGFGQRTTLELLGADRWRRGLQNTQKAEFMGVRERWAQLVNEALRDAGLDARVDPRSLAARGIDREPRPHLSPAVTYLERQSGPSAAGNAIRRLYAERVAAREKGPEELARVIERQRQEIREYAAAKAARPPEELAARRRERVLTPVLASRAPEQQQEGGPDRVPETALECADAKPTREPREARERRQSVSNGVGNSGSNVIDLAARATPAAHAGDVRLTAGTCQARRKAEARRERWAALEAQRVMELRRLEATRKEETRKEEVRKEQARRQMPAATADAGLEWGSARGALERNGGLEEDKSPFRSEGFDLEI